MLDGLQTILSKKVVIPTVNADDLLHRPDKAENDYLYHVQTFVPLGDTTDYSKRLTRRVIDAKTPKGLIVAPYGYGKTSTLVFLWNACEQEDLVAVPPFYCASLLDILKATYGWVKFRIERREPALLADLDDIYSKYTFATVEHMADRYANEHGIESLMAKRLLEGMLADGSLVLELTASNLLFFLDAVASLIQRAGYKGLVVLPDEFQQYFSKGANLRRTVQEFREFVWGLDTRSTPLGVVFSAPDYAESVIQEHGKDIIHRLKKDGLYYRLDDIYTVDFPERLWQRYEKTFQLGAMTDAIMAPHTLTSIGQIAEREDLGEGPRTVIDAFKRAIFAYQQRKRVYTPIMLVDDFLEMNINFQSQTNKFKRVVRQTLESPLVDTPKKEQAIKLMAAFPRGCSADIQQQYNLKDEIDDLSRRAHGKLMTYGMDNDYTLLALSRADTPTRTWDVIVTKFWRSYEQDELHQEGAVRAFTTRLLPRIFDQRRGASPTGWGALSFEPTPRGSHKTLIDGTFNPRFPHRRVAIQVAYAEPQLQPLDPLADIQFDFLLQPLSEDESGQVTLDGGRHARFTLNLDRRLKALPQDLQRLQEYVNPRYVTPLLMLSLIDYFDHYEESSGQPVAETDRAEIEHFIGRLLNYTTDLLFNQGVADTFTPPIRRIGRLMLEAGFNRICRDLYPEYETFFVHHNYEGVFNHYLNAMQGMSLKQRRGRTSVQGTKDELTRRFGLTRRATFETRINAEYKSIIKVNSWSGGGDADAEIALKIHPLEQRILLAVTESAERRMIDGQLRPYLESNRLADIATELGYRDEETFLTLKLLVGRGYLRTDPEAKIIYLVGVEGDPSTLLEEVQKLISDIDKSASLFTHDKLEGFQQEVNALKRRLEEVDEDAEEIDELQTQLNDLQQLLSDQLTEIGRNLRNNIEAIIQNLHRDSIELRKYEQPLQQHIQGQLAFVQHLNEVRQTLEVQMKDLQKRYGQVRKTAEKAIGEGSSGPITEAQSLQQIEQTAFKERKSLTQSADDLAQKTKWLQKWEEMLRSAEALFNSLARLPDLRDRLTGQFVPEVRSHFAKHKVDGLAQWEIFSDKLNEIEVDLDNRRRHGSQLFGDVKTRYETVLREAGVGDYRLRSRYTYGEDEGSYSDLYEAVVEKLTARIRELQQILRAAQSDMSQARHIQLDVLTTVQKEEIQQLELQLTSAQDQIQELHNALTNNLVEKEGDDLAKWQEQLNTIDDSINEIRRQINRILHTEQQLTDAESDLMEHINSSSQQDLAQLFESWLQVRSDTNLTQLLSLLENLYRKRRITIQVRIRR